jgi:NADP-dependent 3-hydroxy acid dehydrogenase YdfG
MRTSTISTEPEDCTSNPRVGLLDLRGKIAVVTGGSSGIGQAVALALASEGAHVCAVGRNVERLGEVAKLAQKFSPASQAFCADLTRHTDIEALAASLARTQERVDILVLCGGEIHHGDHAVASVTDLDAQYQANVRGPYLLIQSVLKLLRIGPGQIVFINSSSGLRAKARGGQFAATQHAMKAIADSLRDEVNADGIRVLSVFPGRTATPRTERLFHEESKAYRPEWLMQPEDVASIVVHSLKLPRTAEVTDISIRPLLKSY